MSAPIPYPAFPAPPPLTLSSGPNPRELLKSPTEPTSVDDELAAMDSVLHTLEPLDQAAQRRALMWVQQRLNPWVAPTASYPVAPVPVDPFHTP